MSVYENGPVKNAEIVIDGPNRKWRYTAEEGSNVIEKLKKVKIHMRVS